MIADLARAAGDNVVGIVAVIMATFFGIVVVYVHFGKWLVDRTGDPKALQEGGHFIARIPVPLGWFSRRRARRAAASGADDAVDADDHRTGSVQTREPLSPPANSLD